jgi:hypothetical protein
MERDKTRRNYLCCMDISRAISQLEELVQPVELRELAVAVIVILTVLVIFPGSTSTSVNLKESIQLQYIDDNVIGTTIMRKNSLTPKPVRKPELKACIYTGRDQPPVVLPVETEKTLFLNTALKTVNMNISIPEDKLDRNYSTEALNITRMEGCPLRSTPKIVVTEEN